MSVLTNVDGNHYYCAVLSFNEKVSITPSKPVDEEEENLTLGNKPILQTPAAITHHNIMYAPKCLVLVSRLDYSDTFKICLGTIYTVYLESLPYLLETLIGNILGCIQIPPAGGPQVRFSIGAGDKQALQPPLSATLPGESRRASCGDASLSKSIFSHRQLREFAVQTAWQEERVAAVLRGHDRAQDFVPLDELLAVDRQLSSAHRADVPAPLHSHLRSDSAGVHP